MAVFRRFLTNGPIRMGKDPELTNPDQYIPEVHLGAGVPEELPIGLYNRGGSHVRDNESNAAVPPTIGVGNVVTFANYYQTSNYSAAEFPDLPYEDWRFYPVAPLPDFNYPGEYYPFEDFFDEYGDDSYQFFDRELYPDFQFPGNPNANVGDMFELISGASIVNTPGLPIIYSDIRIDGKPVTFEQDETTGAVSILVERDHPVINNFADIKVEFDTANLYEGEALAETTRTFEAAYARNPIDAGSDTEADRRNVLGGASIGVEKIKNLPVNYEVFFLPNDDLAAGKIVLQKNGDSEVIDPDTGETTFSVYAIVPEDLPLETEYRLYIENTDSPHDFDFVSQAGSNTAQVYTRVTELSDPLNRGAAPSMSWDTSDPIQGERITFTLSSDFLPRNYQAAPPDILEYSYIDADPAELPTGAGTALYDSRYVAQHYPISTNTIGLNADDIIAAFEEIPPELTTESNFQAGTAAFRSAVNDVTNYQYAASSSDAVVEDNRVTGTFNLEGGGTASFTNFTVTINGNLHYTEGRNTGISNWQGQLWWVPPIGGNNTFRSRNFIQFETGGRQFVYRTWNARGFPEALSLGTRSSLMEYFEEEFRPGPGLTPEQNNGGLAEDFSFEVYSIPDEVPAADEYWEYEITNNLNTTPVKGRLYGFESRTDSMGVERHFARVAYSTQADQHITGDIKADIRAEGVESYGLSYRKVFKRLRESGGTAANSLIGFTSVGGKDLMLHTVNGVGGINIYNITDETSSGTISAVSGDGDYNRNYRPFWISNDVVLYPYNVTDSAGPVRNSLVRIVESTSNPSGFTIEGANASGGGDDDLDTFHVSSNGDIFGAAIAGNTESLLGDVDNWQAQDSNGDALTYRDEYRTGILAAMNDTMEGIGGSFNTTGIPGETGIFPYAGFYEDASGLYFYAYNNSNIMNPDGENNPPGWWRFTLVDKTAATDALSPTTFNLKRPENTELGYSEIDVNLRFAGNPVANVETNATKMGNDIVTAWNEASTTDASLIAVTANVDENDEPDGSYTVEINTNVNDTSGVTLTEGSGSASLSEGSISTLIVDTTEVPTDRIILGGNDGDLGFASATVGLVGNAQYDFSGGTFPTEGDAPHSLDEDFTGFIDGLSVLNITRYYRSGSKYLGQTDSGVYDLSTATNLGSRIYPEGTSSPDVYFDTVAGTFNGKTLSIVPTEIVYLGVAGGGTWYAMNAGGVYYVFDGETPTLFVSDVDPGATGGGILTGGTSSGTFRDLAFTGGGYLNMSIFDGADFPYSDIAEGNPWQTVSVGSGMVYDYSSAAWYYLPGSDQHNGLSVAGTRNFNNINYAINVNAYKRDENGDFVEPLEFLDDTSSFVLQKLGTDGNGNIVTTTGTYLNEVNVS